MPWTRKREGTLWIRVSRETVKPIAAGVNLPGTGSFPRRDRKKPPEERRKIPTGRALFTEVGPG